MQHNDLAMLGYRITRDLQEFIDLLVSSKQIDKRTREYLRMVQVRQIVSELAGFNEENEDGR